MLARLVWLRRFLRGFLRGFHDTLAARQVQTSGYALIYQAAVFTGLGFLLGWWLT